MVKVTTIYSDFCYFLTENAEHFITLLDFKLNKPMLFRYGTVSKQFCVSCTGSATFLWLFLRHS